MPAVRMIALSNVRPGYWLVRMVLSAKPSKSMVAPGANAPVIRNSSTIQTTRKGRQRPPPVDIVVIAEGTTIREIGHAGKTQTCAATRGAHHGNNVSERYHRFTDRRD